MKPIVNNYFNTHFQLLLPNLRIFKLYFISKLNFLYEKLFYMNSRNDEDVK